MRIVLVVDGGPTEKWQDLDDSEKCCPGSGLVEQLWNEEEHEDSAVDESDGSENHLDGERL